MTIATIKNSINVAEQVKACPYAFEDLNDTEIVKIATEVEIVKSIQKVSICNQVKLSYSNTITTYEIVNENVINFLRELYKITSNSFAKSVIAKVGQDKKFSSKQMETITAEAFKFENLSINF
jgi:hypothetical protein